MTGEQTGLSGNHDNRKADPMSEAFCSTGVQTAFSEEGRWGFGKPGEAQDASSGTNSGQVKIPSDFLNERKLSERDNKGNDKEKPAGSFCPPSAEEYLSVPSTQTNHRKATVTETSAISSVQRRRWQSEPSLGFRYRGQVLVWSDQRSITTRRKREPTQRGKSCSQRQNAHSVSC